MNKFLSLVKRNLLEIVRDPLSLVFCVCFPLVMLVLMQVIMGQFEATPPNFEISNYSIGMCVFGYTFVALFVANLIAGDKNTEFYNRLKLAPMSAFLRVLGYVVAVLPIMLVQTVLFLLLSLFFGLPFGVSFLLAIVYLFPSALFYVLCGVLIGYLVQNERQAGPVASILVSATGIFAGIFMPITQMGTFSDIMNCLPFVHTVSIASGVFSGDYACILNNIGWVFGYSMLILLLIYLFCRKKS